MARNGDDKMRKSNNILSRRRRRKTHPLFVPEEQKESVFFDLGQRRVASRFTSALMPIPLDRLR
jgi:hypothetical protein